MTRKQKERLPVTPIITKVGCHGSLKASAPHQLLLSQAVTWPAIVCCIEFSSTVSSQP